MSLFRTLNALRRETVGLALQTLGFTADKSRAGKGAVMPYRTFDAATLRRVATPQQATIMPTVLQVRDLVRETADAVSIVLGRADGQPIDFKAGMFFTVFVTIEGQEYRRAYSASSAAHAHNTVGITVKRVAHGKVSNWLNDQLTVGSTLRVLGPSGSFVVTPNPAHPRKLLLVGGGSGITPLMSIARTLLAQEPGTHITLLYGNRSKKDVIFYAALAAFEKEVAPRFTVAHILEKAPKAWKGEVGRLDGALFARLLDGVLATAALEDLEVYTCGPEPMMAVVADAVLGRGLLPSHFHQEKFTPAAGATDVSRFSEQSVAIESGGQTWTARVQPGQTLLEAGLANGAPMLFSCTLGGCGRCRVKVTEGEVDMPEPNCLLPHEREQGYALACIARPCSAVRFTIDPPHAH